MTETVFYDWLLRVWFALTGVTLAALFFTSAPYGRHVRTGWGPTVASQMGWLVMEAPAAILFALYFAAGEHTGLTAWVFLIMWETHYIYRAFVYPWRLRDTGKRMPVVVMALGILFNLINTYANGRYLFTFSGGYPQDWLWDVRFVVGAAVFIGGLLINRQADATLRQLRAPGESVYRIPEGGLFRWVSAANYLGEIIEWVGWAVATWSLAGLAFAVWTIANLAPRARAHHRWYQENFSDYPPDRHALVPGVW